MSLDRMGDKAAKSGDPLPDRCAARMAEEEGPMFYSVNESESQKKRLKRAPAQTSGRGGLGGGLGEPAS